MKKQQFTPKENKTRPRNQETKKTKKQKQQKKCQSPSPWLSSHLPWGVQCSFLLITFLVWWHNFLKWDLLRENYRFLSSNLRPSKEIAATNLQGEHVHLRASLFLVSQLHPHRQRDGGQSAQIFPLGPAQAPQQVHRRWQHSLPAFNSSNQSLQKVQVCVVLLPRADQQAEVEGQELQCQAHGHEEAIQKQEVRVLSGKLS